MTNGPCRKIVDYGGQDEPYCGRPKGHPIHNHSAVCIGALEHEPKWNCHEFQPTQATDGAPKMLNAEHARRIAWDRIFKAIWESRNCLENVKYESACALADAYAADFIEKVETYTENFNAVAEELKRRG